MIILIMIIIAKHFKNSSSLKNGAADYLKQRQKVL